MVSPLRKNKCRYLNAPFHTIPDRMRDQNFRYIVSPSFFLPCNKPMSLNKLVIGYPYIVFHSNRREFQNSFSHFRYYFASSLHS